MKSFLFVLTLVLLTACTPASPTSIPATAVATPVPTTAAADLPLRAALEREKGWVCPPEFAGQTLSVANWDLYIAEDTIANFETLCGVTVNYAVFGSNEDLLEQMRTGSAAYDVVVPSDYAIAIMIGENLLHPLNFANIPNFVNISADLRNPPYDPDSRFSVPYQWGTIGILYNITRTREAITSWQQMLEYTRGSVNWLEDTRGMMGMALNKLSYSPNSQNRDEINAARDFLIANAGNVAAVVEYGSYDPLIAGAADMAVEYSGSFYLIASQCGCDDFRFSIPQEGTNLWVDNIAIPASAPNPRLAEAFIDYILQPQVAADISNFTAYASPNQTAINLGLIDEAFLSNVNIYPSDEVRGHLYFTDTDPTTQQMQLEGWEAVKAAIGS
ncbi:MAG: spermidine/putrescine ABC transporter substrate-binding protein [Anaerolineae bacterium]